MVVLGCNAIDETSLQRYQITVACVWGISGSLINYVSHGDIYEGRTSDKLHSE